MTTKKQNRRGLVRRARRILNRSLAAINSMSMRRAVRNGYGAGLNARSIPKSDEE